MDGKRRLDRTAALALTEDDNLPALMARARAIKLDNLGPLVTYSPKVFLPLTHLCRDVCHYCTFAQSPRRQVAPYMPLEEVLRICRQGAAIGCTEALITLGDKPEKRYRAAREALAADGFASTIHYVAHVARAIINHTGLLPHVNAGPLNSDELALLRPVSPSMGLMLESSADRLCERGGPHYGSPDKRPSVRLATIEAAGRARIPFTSGLLVGIGETRRERIETLLALRDQHDVHGQLQEIIVQPFRAKAGTRMADVAEAASNELLWTIAVARLVFGGEVSVQVPPNLANVNLGTLIEAGIDDWGGVSPLTIDHVNPERAWPALTELQHATALAGDILQPRLTVHARYVRRMSEWIDPKLAPRIRAMSDSEGFARGSTWVTGTSTTSPPTERALMAAAPTLRSPSDIDLILAAAADGARLGELQVTQLFSARGRDFSAVCTAADALRKATCGDVVGYVVNRNINYTNICTYACGFCGFSKGRKGAGLRDAAYQLDIDEIVRRSREAVLLGATEVCMQGGIHPSYTGQTYLDICAAVRKTSPQLHIHAFSPLEVTHGAATLGLSISQFLERLRAAGLDTLPGTAAEILDDEVRAIICPDKLGTAAWLSVVGQAHRQGIRTTATIMFGHVDRAEHWARHLLQIRKLQEETGGFTEFVPLPFVAHEAPIFLRGKARAGPTFREAVLMHAVARIALAGAIDNIQASWVKLGPDGVAACLAAGVNDLGGTLMDESITRAAGATHGQMFDAVAMEALIVASNRTPRQRTTLYGDAIAARTSSAEAVTARYGTSMATAALVA